MGTNLPPTSIDDSGIGTRLFFDSYGQQPLEFLANDVEAAIAFFESRGFDKDAATVTGMTLLKQAKLENQPIFQVLDTLSGFNSLQISALVGEILNNNRPSTSTLGFKVSNAVSLPRSRNIAA